MTRTTDELSPISVLVEWTGVGWPHEVSATGVPGAASRRTSNAVVSVCHKATIDAARPTVTSHLPGHRATNSITLLSTFRWRRRKQSNIDVDVLIR